MLDCLKSKVTWYDGCGTKPAALLLNNLPGFNINFADYVTDDRKKSAAEVLNSCIENGAQKVEDDVRSFLMPNQTGMEGFQNMDLGIISDNLKERPQDGNMYGVRIDLCRAKFIAFQLNRISFFPKETGTGTLRVYDLLTGVQKSETAISFAGGQVNTYPVDTVYTFDGQPINLAVVIETTATVYDVQPYSRDNSCSVCRLTGRYINEWMYADAVKINLGAPKVENNAKSAAHTGGVFINYNFICDISDYICGQSAGLKLAVWYAAGMLAMKEIIHSDRINSATTVGKDDAMKLLDDYMQEYNNIMGRVQRSTTPPNTPCFVCNKRVNVNTRIP